MENKVTTEGIENVWKTCREELLTISLRLDSFRGFIMENVKGWLKDSNTDLAYLFSIPADLTSMLQPADDVSVNKAQWTCEGEHITPTCYPYP